MWVQQWKENWIDAGIVLAEIGGASLAISGLIALALTI